MNTRVAIVEDDAVLRSFLEQIVEDSPSLSCAAAWDTAEEALRQIGKVSADVVLMDIHLPCMSGIECAARLKAAHPTLQILMLTMYEDIERIFDALKAGATGYLLKRSRPSQIIEAIHDIREGGSPMSSHIARKVVQSFRAPTAAPKEEILSRREQEILQLSGKGYSIKEVAQELSVSVNTIKTHLRNIYEKLHVRSRMEALIAVSGGTVFGKGNRTT